MKKTKEIIYYLCIFYMVVILALFIKQSITVHNKLSKSYEINPTDEYQAFIDTAKVRLNGYLLRVDTEEEKACLDTIDKAIEFSYQNQSLGKVTYKQILERYYNDDTDGKKYFYYYPDIAKKCDMKSEKISKLLLNNMQSIEKKLNQNLMSYQLNFNIIDIFSPNSSSYYYNEEEEFRRLVINNEKKYIESLLDLVGERYD